jgi:hypothetical protein
MFCLQYMQDLLSADTPFGKSCKGGRISADGSRVSEHTLSSQAEVQEDQAHETEVHSCSVDKCPDRPELGLHLSSNDGSQRLTEATIHGVQKHQLLIEVEQTTLEQHCRNQGLNRIQKLTIVASNPGGEIRWA